MPRWTGEVSFEPGAFPGLAIPLGELWQLPEWFNE